MNVNSMNETPMSSRMAIGLFGKRNAGKSSLINALTDQSVAVISDVAGTTTDPVYKTMELLPIGPVVFIDTAGLDDTGELGMLRIEKTYEVLRKCHFAIVVADIETGITEFEEEFIDQLIKRKIPSVFVLNKADKGCPAPEEIEALKKTLKIPLSFTSVYNGSGIKAVKQMIIDHANYEDVEPALVGDLIESGDMVVLVTPIDKSAPKGRLILPQQQTIRDILEKDAVAMITKEHELKHTLENLAKPPALVITDSQAFLKVSADTPADIPLTSFSILFARQKTDLAEMVKGIKRIEQLAPGDKVLIVEGCTHHRQADDIGKVKIPRWIRQITGCDIEFHWASGAHYPKDIDEYAVIVHCGGCMLNRREMQYRVHTARNKGVHITNYGMLIAYVQGILSRALEPFPAAKLALEENQLN